MWIKIVVLLVLAAVAINLFTALFHLVRGGEGHSQRTLKFLILRLVLSIALFGGLYVLASLGYIQPHGLPQVAAPATQSPSP